MNRIYHTWDEWECYPAGFYETKPPRKDWSVDDCKRMYAEFLADDERFGAASNRVITEWKYSSEHYLTNEKMNRIAWMGQAAMCIETRVSKFFCGGYFLLDEDQRKRADEVALIYINKWMVENGYPELTMEQAIGRSKADLY